MHLFDVVSLYTLYMRPYLANTSEFHSQHTHIEIHTKYNVAFGKPVFSEALLILFYPKPTSNSRLLFGFGQTCKTGARYSGCLEYSPTFAPFFVPHQKTVAIKVQRCTHCLASARPPVRPAFGICIIKQIVYLNRLRSFVFYSQVRRLEWNGRTNHQQCWTSRLYT